MKIPTNKPLAQYAVYATTKRGKTVKVKSVQYITDKEIEKVLREAAAEVYDIKCKHKLAKFSSHSFRVGACVQLHVANKDPEFIKFRLRWRSKAFKMYLRNIPALAKQHLQALTASVF